uniref:Proteasome 26S subunit, ATPase 1 n=1 Tax=Salmo trutta TaxID=8032 RepID=A0A674F4L1_SALTR
QGQSQSGGQGGKKDDKENKKYEPPILTRIGKRKKKSKGPDVASKLPLVTPHTHCRLTLLTLLTQERIKDYLLMEEEFIRNQEKKEQMKSLEEKQEEERSKVDDLRGTRLSVGNQEEIIGVYISRIDRKIEFPLPDEKTKRIFNIHTSRMTVPGLSAWSLGRLITAICTEAGLMALRERRTKENVLYKKPEGLYL